MKEDIESVVETIRQAFQTRDFGPMVEAFAQNGIYETPYAAENSRSEGIDAIRQRFALITNSPWNKAVKIEDVSLNATPAADGGSFFVEFKIKGTSVKDQTPFDFYSSVAIIQIRNDKIVSYRDYPNVAGIRQAAGI